MTALAFWRRYALAYAEFVGALLAPLVAMAIESAAARLLPQPPTPPAPTPEQRAAGLASTLAGRLWDRYRDPAGDAHLSAHGRHMAILYAAVLDDETVRWLARLIQREHEDGPDAPPLSHDIEEPTP